MSGRSGSAVASHTRLAWLPDVAIAFSVSPVQAEIIDRALKQGGACNVDGQLRSARVLVSLKLGTLVDDCPEDGGCWVFQLVEGVVLR